MDSMPTANQLIGPSHLPSSASRSPSLTGCWRRRGSETWSRHRILNRRCMEKPCRLAVILNALDVCITDAYLFGDALLCLTMAENSTLQLVDADGEFGTKQMEEFSHSSGLVSAGLKYQVVAIMGPQSSGKSTLVNHVVRFLALVSPIFRNEAHSLARGSKKWTPSWVDVRPHVAFGLQRRHQIRNW